MAPSPNITPSDAWYRPRVWSGERSATNALATGDEMISPRVQIRTITASAGIDFATTSVANASPTSRVPSATIRVRDRRPVQEVIGSSSRTTMMPFSAWRAPYTDVE